MEIIYVENKIAKHPRVERIIKKLQPSHVIYCEQYKEVFNSKNQNFKLQKQQPALILAEKNNNLVLPSPPNFGIGGTENYYFSHMLNCLYDCRYCFLQGMYSSANYVVFVNYEDFMQDIRLRSEKAAKPIYFFSGYDCDSLAYEPVTQFAEEFVPFFRGLKNGVLELRTKSTNVKSLLTQPSYPHCIVAFSFTPDEISAAVEHKVPSVEKRLQALKQVADHGWPIGLRFDPLIYHSEFELLYKKLLDDIFAAVNPASIHSVSTGPLRFPGKMYQKITKLYPQDALLTQPLYRQGNLFSYRSEIETAMQTFIHDYLKHFLSSSLLFECHV